MGAGPAGPSKGRELERPDGSPGTNSSSSSSSSSCPPLPSLPTAPLGVCPLPSTYGALRQLARRQGPTGRRVVSRARRRERHVYRQLQPPDLELKHAKIKIIVSLLL